MIVIVGREKDRMLIVGLFAAGTVDAAEIENPG
jgi:hypothetical protein